MEKRIFMKLINRWLPKLLKLLYDKYEEEILYLFFGGLTFVISIFTYALFTEICRINELIANIISWIIAVLFAYCTNRTWVFESHADSIKKLFSEMFSFFCGRIATLIIEEIILFVFIIKMGFGNMVVKIIAQIIVIVLNYIISKIWVFR